jgi:hypothetical protein
MRKRRLSALGFGDDENRLARLTAKAMSGRVKRAICERDPHCSRCWYSVVGRVGSCTNFTCIGVVHGPDAGNNSSKRSMAASWSTRSVLLSRFVMNQQ